MANVARFLGVFLSAGLLLLAGCDAADEPSSGSKSQKGQGAQTDDEEGDVIVDDDQSSDSNDSSQANSTGRHYCSAEGAVRKCVDNNGFENCYTERVTGGGRGDTEQAARADALSNCASNLTSATSIGNLGGSATIASTCEITGCEVQ